MSLEHRWSARKQVYINTIALHRPTGMMQTVIQDIGLEGVFIRCPSIQLPLQAMVELTFALNIAGKQTMYQMQAMVIHQAGNGYGLMFKDFRLDAYRAIRGMLYAA